MAIWTVWENLGEAVPEETFTHSHLSWLSIIPYLLPPSFMMHGILLVQFMCLTVFFHNLQVFFSLPLDLAASTSYSIHHAPWPRQPRRQPIAPDALPAAQPTASKQGNKCKKCWDRSHWKILVAWVTQAPQPWTKQNEKRAIFCLLCSSSVLWCCWLKSRKGIRPVKIWMVGCWHGCVWVEGQICIWPSWYHYHSLSLAPVNLDSFTFLVPAYLGSPGQRAIKWV